MKKLALLFLVLTAAFTLALGAGSAIGATHISICGQFHDAPAGLEEQFDQLHGVCHELQHSGIPTSIDIPIDIPGL